MKDELGDFIEASGLLSYDPAAITRIYRKNPNRLIKRFWETLIPLTLFLIGVGTDKLFGLLKNEKKARNRAIEFTNLLVSLGPAF